MERIIEHIKNILGNADPDVVIPWLDCLIRRGEKLRVIEMGMDMDKDELENLKGIKSRAIIDLKSKNGRYNKEECKSIAIQEFQIAIQEIKRGFPEKALLNIESAKRFIDRVIK